MKNENYLTIQGWMRNDLNLKGNELMVYALIYGFSQDKESCFTGSVGYIAEWIGSTKQTVHNILRSLLDKNMIDKQESYHNGIKFCSYKAILPPVKKFDSAVKNFDRGSQKILPNNIDDTINKKIECIIDYLNTKLGTKYRASTKATKDVIKARLKEKFTVEDFKTVIDKKAEQWKGTPMEEFLRPQTLFGTKFESYLNQTIVKEEKKQEPIVPRSKAYKEFEPEPEIEAVEMPDDVRENYNRFMNGL